MVRPALANLLDQHLSDVIGIAKAPAAAEQAHVHQAGESLAGEVAAAPAERARSDVDVAEMDQPHRLVHRHPRRASHLISNIYPALFIPVQFPQNRSTQVYSGVLAKDVVFMPKIVVLNE